MAGILQNGIWCTGFDYCTNATGYIFDNTNLGVFGSAYARFPAITGAVSQGYYMNSYFNQGIKSLLTQLPTIITGFAFQYGSIPPVTYRGCFGFYDTVGGNTQLTLVVNPQRQLAFYKGGLGTAYGAQLGSNSTIALNVGSWYYIEVKVVFSATVGMVECRLNGNTTPIISATGLNTLTTANAWTDRLIMGSDGSATPLNPYYDDWYVLDTTGTAPLNTYLGDIKIVTLMPNADSATVGLNAFSTSPAQVAGSHYLNVKETPPDDNVTYNYDATVGDRESYRYPAAPTAATIYCVNALARFYKDDANARSCAITARSNATDSVGTTINSPSSYTYFNQIYPTDPNTGLAWTPTGWNAGAELGLKVIS